MKKQLLVILMLTIVLATVFVAGCTGPVESTVATTSKITATTIPSSVPSPKATTVPTAHVGGL